MKICNGNNFNLDLYKSVVEVFAKWYRGRESTNSRWNLEYYFEGPIHVMFQWIDDFLCVSVGFFIPDIDIDVVNQNWGDCKAIMSNDSFLGMRISDDFFSTCEKHNIVFKDLYGDNNPHVLVDKVIEFPWVFDDSDRVLFNRFCSVLKEFNSKEYPDIVFKYHEFDNEQITDYQNFQNCESEDLIADSLYKLASFYCNGDYDKEINHQKAVCLLEQAIEAGSSKAYGLLGNCYKNGEGVKKDLSRSFELYYQGAEKGDDYSEFQVGYSYAYGEGTLPNLPKAIVWLEKSASKGFEGAYGILGEIYSGESLGVSPDYDKAIYYFSHIEDSNTDEIAEQANYYLGSIYSQKLNDHYSAFKYWKKSAEMGNAVSQENLGYMYYNGWGTKVDYSQAKYWFTQAANQGSDNAKQCLIELNVQMNSSQNSSSGGCYIATAVYGSYDCPEVWTLRRYRDYSLAETWYGRAFIRTYYTISPTLVKWFGDTSWFKRIWKKRLDNMVRKLNSEGYDDSPYNDQ